jgi:hypothetical protein
MVHAMTEQERPAWAARLQTEREARGWSKAEMARQLQRAAGDTRKTTESLVRQMLDWEKGKNFPRDWHEYYATAFGLTDRSLFSDHSSEALAPRQALPEHTTPTPQHSGPVAPELVDYFRTQLAGHYQADMMLGPRALIGTVSAQSDLIEQLLDAADSGTRQRLTEVGTAYRAFVGWLYLDAGDAMAAARWHGAALELAHRSGNRDAIACTLVDLAMARTDQGAGRAVVDLCNGALKDAPHLSPEVRVFALQQQAHGEALLPGRDRAAVDRTLDQAAALVGQVDYEEWGTACLRTPHYVEIQRATCYGRLGLADDADRLWQQLIPSEPGTSLRDVGVWTARHATARAHARDPEHAVELAQRATSIAVTTGSARARRELAELNRVMRPWQDAGVGRDLAEILAPVNLEA